MGSLTIFSSQWGEVEISEADLSQAGIVATFLPRYTEPWEPCRTGLVSFSPQKNVEILEDFLTLYLRGEAHR